MNRLRDALNRLWTVVKAEPWLSAAFLVLSVGVCAPFWMVHYLPFLDAPQHLSTIAVLHGLGDPTTGFDAYYTGDLASTQYLLYYVSCDWLSYLVGVEHANQVFLTIYAVLLPLSVLYALTAFGRFKPAALLAFPLVFNAFLFFGFINYVFAFPLFFLGLGLAERAARDARWKTAREVWLALVAIAIFYSHLQIFLVYVGAVGLVVLFARLGWRRTVGRFLHLLPALGLFLFWVLGSSGLAGGAAWEGEVSKRYASLTGAQWEPLRDTISQAGNRLLCVYTDTWDERVAVAVVIGALIVLALRGAGQRSDRPFLGGLAPEVLTLFVALFYICLPTSYKWIWPVNWRFLPLAMLLLLMWGRAQVPRWLEIGLTVLFAAVAAGAIWLHVVRFKAFDAEAREFDQVLAEVTPGSRLLSVIFDSGSAVIDGPAYLHFGQYHVVRQGGMAVYSFAEAPQSPVRFRPRAEGGPPPTPLRSEWKPNDFRFDTDNRFYDYFLVRGEPAAFSSRVRFGDEVTLVTRVGKWTLYHYDRK